MEPEMPIRTSIVSLEKARSILQRTEGQFCDMKARDIAPAKLSRTLSAFANADGGEVFLGVAENGDSTFKWDGFPNDEAVNAHIQVLDKLFPIDHITRCEFLTCETLSGKVLHIIDVVPTAEPEDWLTKQKLIVKSKPTVAGVLLFSDEPQTLLPKAAVKLYRYKTNDSVGTRATLIPMPLVPAVGTNDRAGYRRSVSAWSAVGAPQAAQ